MYVRMKKYPRWIGPYQIAGAILFWVKENHYSDTILDKFGDWLAYNSKGERSWLNNVCEWIYKKRKARRVKVRIDKYDVWSMYYDLALIILPMLKKLKEDKNGSPDVEDEDVPERLRSTSADPKNNEYDLDEFFHNRWDYVLDEMIWAFEEIVKDDEIFTGQDHYNRIVNGTRLFGKYYQNLWW